MPTVQTKSIGTATRDYSTFALFEAAIPANLVTADEQWIGEAYNDSVFSVAGTVLNIAGHTTDATRDIIVRCASGESFKDHADAATNRLYPNDSYGVKMRTTSSWSQGIEITDANVTIDGIQFDTAGNSGFLGTLNQDNITVIDCVSESDGEWAIFALNHSGVSIVNTVIIMADDREAIRFNESGSNDPQLINCTILSPSDVTSTNNAIDSGYGSNHGIVKGCLILGFNGVTDGNANATSSDYNTTDNSTVEGGSNDTVSVTYANQIEATTATTIDARLKSGSDAEGAATAYAETNDLDIIGQARHATAPDCGAWEYTVAAGGDVDAQLKQINFTVFNPTVEAGGPEFTQIATASNNADNATSFTVNVPTGTTDDDMMILAVSSDGSSTVSLPAGWTEQQNHNTAGTHNNVLATRVASSEPASYTITLSPGERAWGCITTYRGASGIPTVESSNSNTGGADTTGVITSITPTANNSMVYVFVGLESGNEGNPVVTTWPGSLVEVNDNVNGPPGTGDASSSGATAVEIQEGTGTAVSGNIALTGGNTNWGTMAIVLNPYTAPGGDDTLLATLYTLDRGIGQARAARLGGELQ